MADQVLVEGIVDGGPGQRDPRCGTVPPDLVPRISHRPLRSYILNTPNRVGTDAA